MASLTFDICFHVFLLECGSDRLTDVAASMQKMHKVDVTALFSPFFLIFLLKANTFSVLLGYSMVIGYSKDGQIEPELK